MVYSIVDGRKIFQILVIILILFPILDATTIQRNEISTEDEQKYSIQLVDDHSNKRHNDDSTSLDPFSVLGVLSFATFILTVIYNQYKMKNKEMKATRPPAGTSDPETPMKSGLNFNTNNQEDNLGQILNKVTHALSDSYILERFGLNATDNFSDTDLDYYDEELGFKKRTLKSRKN